MNYYKILEIDEKSTPIEIKRAYRRLAQKHHPDKKTGDAEKFKLIKEAYDTLILEFNSKNTKPDNSKNTSDYTYGYKETTDYTYGYKEPEYNYDFHTVIINFSDIFGGSLINIPNTMYYLEVPYGTRDGDIIKRIIGKTNDKLNVCFFNIKFNILDPSGFYYTKKINKIDTLCCKINVTISMILLEYEMNIRNINKNNRNISINVSTENIRIIKNYGLPLLNGNRGDLCIEQIVDFKKLNDEIYPILTELKIKIDDILNSGNFNQYIK